MFKIDRLLGSALLACALFAGPTVHADENGVHLIIPPKVGRVTRTRTYMKIEMMGMTIVAEGTSRDIIKAVQENGDVVMQTIEEGNTITAAGNTQKQEPEPPSISTRDKFGKTKENDKATTGGLVSPEVDKLMRAITDIILTDKALKPGDTWENELDNPVIKEKKVTLKDTYLGLEKVDGKDYWKIKQATEAVVDADGNKVTYEVFEWIDPTSGEAYKFSGNIKGVPTPVGLLSMQVNTRVIPLDEKPAPTAGKASGPTPKKKDN